MTLIFVAVRSRNFKLCRALPFSSFVELFFEVFFEPTLAVARLLRSSKYRLSIALVER